jgi:RimJ/RimL family protein N-acetyltransferase
MSQRNVELRQWSELSAHQRDQVKLLTISSQQIEYAGAAEAQIQSVENGSGTDLVGLAILQHEAIVGFLVLKRASMAPKWAPPGAAVISGMRIDAAHQGRGLSRMALLQLPAWLRSHWMECTVLGLSVDEENHQGIRAYAAAGFEDLGQRIQGRIGWVRYMSKPLS